MIGRLIFLINAFRNLFRIKKHINDLVYDKELVEEEHREISDLFEAVNPGGRKKRMSKFKKEEPCLITLKHSLKYTLIITVVSSLIMSGIFGLFLYKLFTSQHIVALETKQDNLIKGAEIKLIVDELKLVELGMVGRKKELGYSVYPWTRLTDKEFFDIATLLYKNIQENVLFDWRGFIASICAESEWNKRSLSETGAKGLNQVMDETFIWVLNKDGDFEQRDIYNVFYNTKVGIKYVNFCHGYLYTKLGRLPVLEEIYAAYNCGHTLAGRALQTSNSEKYLPNETIRHMKKIRFYYDNICQKNYNFCLKDVK